MTRGSKKNKHVLRVCRRKFEIILKMALGLLAEFFASCIPTNDCSSKTPYVASPCKGTSCFPVDLTTVLVTVHIILHIRNWLHSGRLTWKWKFTIFNREFPCSKGPFSIAMFVYRSVYARILSLKSQAPGARSKTLKPNSS